MNENVTPRDTGESKNTSVAATLFHTEIPSRTMLRCISAAVTIATARVPMRVTVKENPNSLISKAPK